MTVAMIAGALTLFGLAFFHNLAIYLTIMGFASFFLGLGSQFGNIAVQGVVKLSEAGAAAGIMMTVFITAGGIAVVIGSACLATFSTSALPDQHAVSLTFVVWGVIVGVLGFIFGLWQWKNATLPDADDDTEGKAIDRALENKVKPA